MKVKELVEALRRFDLESDVKILSMHYPNEKLFHFAEKNGYCSNVASGHLDDVGTVIETVDKDGKNKEVYVCDRGAFGTMMAGEEVRKANRDKNNGR